MFFEWTRPRLGRRLSRCAAQKDGGQLQNHDFRFHKQRSPDSSLSRRGSQRAPGMLHCAPNGRERGVEWSNMANGTQLRLFPDSDGKETSILLMVFHKMNNKFR